VLLHHADMKEALGRKGNIMQLNLLTNINIWAALRTAEKFCSTAELKNANMLVAQSSHTLLN